MKAVAGVFRNRIDAERGARGAHGAGIPADKLNLLTPNSTEAQVQAVPVSDSEPPGIGTALGAAVGGTVGLGGGFFLGEMLTALLIPGIGPIAAAGVAGAAILGALGAVGGGAVGKAADNAATEGLPGDEIFVYEDALRQGRSVVIAMAENEEQADVARGAFKEAGAESIDEARHQWWIGLRSAQKEKYEGDGKKFEKDEAFFRRGFEAALHTGRRSMTYDEALDDLRYNYPDSYSHAAFKQGFERGQEYLRATREVPLQSRSKTA